MSTTILQPANRASVVDVSAFIPPPTLKPKPPIELRQRKVLLPCGAAVLRADISTTVGDRVYTVGIYPGFVGGGRDEDMSQAPRLRHSASTPKIPNPTTGALLDVYPPVPPLEWRIDGVLMGAPYKPMNHVGQRLESALGKVEPLLRQLINQRQIRLDEGRPGYVADQPLIARIKTILSDF